MLLICEKNVANYDFCWLCKIFDKFHACRYPILIITKLYHEMFRPCVLHCTFRHLKIHMLIMHLNLTVRPSGNTKISHFKILSLCVQFILVICHYSLSVAMIAARNKVHLTPNKETVPKSKHSQIWTGSKVPPNPNMETRSKVRSHPNMELSKVVRFLYCFHF